MVECWDGNHATHDEAEGTLFGFLGAVVLGHGARVMHDGMHVCR
jgi:hypothetical protein